MPEATLFRRARPDDGAAAGRLLARLDALHREALPWLCRAPGEATRATADFAAWIHAHAVFVAEHDGDLVGIVHGTTREAPDLPVFVPRRYGVIDGLTVASEWRRRGIGRRLVAAFEAWARSAGASGLELNVYAFNDEARRFYEALGYAPLRTTLHRPLEGSD